MRMYFLYSDNTWSDLADYPETPDSRVGGEWVTGEPKGLEPQVEVSLATLLMAQYMALPSKLRGAFSPYMAGVESCLNQSPPDYEGAKSAVEEAPVPTELEPIRQKLLEIFTAKGADNA